MYQLKCVICLKEFEARILHKKACSQACRKLMSLSYHQNNYYKDKCKHSGKCEYCLNMIIGDSRKRYCSKKCKRQAERVRLYPLIEKICPCGEKFQTRRETTVFCSQGCTNHFCKSHLDIILKCKECGEEFERKYIQRFRTFCSKSCSTSWKNKHVMTEESYKKGGETRKRKYVSGEIVHPWAGRQHSEKTKNKISEYHLENKTFSGENNPMYGKHHTIETCNKISKTRSEKILDGSIMASGSFNKFYKQGQYFSSKLNKEIHFRSSWEEKVFKILDNDNNILSYTPEPFSIPYYYFNENQKRHYIPDLLITYKTGIQKLVEIKPAYLLTANKNVCKFNAAEIYCDEKGLIFEVWTEKEINKFVGKTSYSRC